MPELLTYLLKVNVALVLFYLAYHVALRRLTFYHLNRLYLVFGIVFSTIYPFINLAELFAEHKPIVNTYLVTIPVWALTGQPVAQTQTFDYWQLPVYLFWAGVIVMLIRFIVQLVSLYKIHTASEPANYKNIGFRQVTTISQAFSFWQTIYLNPEQHHRDELEKILHHELIHITGWHTLDVMLAELSTVFYWFNPGAWLMKKAVKENLEFIADQNVVNTGVDKKEYQYLLLKVVGATQPQIANQFNFPSLKRRIAMMNKMPDRNSSKLRLLIILPLVSVLLVAFRSAASEIETIATETEIQQNNDKILPKELIEHLKKNSAIKNVRGRIIDGKDAVVINLKGGGTEVYYLNDGNSIAELERKYGLPELPTPPPPMPANEELPPPPPPAPEAPKLLPPPAPELPAPPAPIKDNAIPTAGLPESATYYIDGVKSSLESVKKLNPKQIYLIIAVNGERAKELLGDDSDNEIVSITTEKNRNSERVKEFNQKFKPLSTPAPPVIHDAPLVPASGAKLVEDNKSITYILWPNDFTKRELEVAQQTFSANGFELIFKEHKGSNGKDAINITLRSKKLDNNTSATHTFSDLITHHNVIVVKGFKDTGKVMIGTSIPSGR